METDFYNEAYFEEQSGKVKSLLDAFNKEAASDELDTMLRYLRRCNWNPWAAKMVIDILDSSSISNVPNMEDELDKFLGIAIENLPSSNPTENEKLDAILELSEWKFSSEEYLQLRPTIEVLKSLDEINNDPSI